MSMTAVTAIGSSIPSMQLTASLSGPSYIPSTSKKIFFALKFVSSVKIVPLDRDKLWNLVNVSCPSDLSTLHMMPRSAYVTTWFWGHFQGFDVVSFNKSATLRSALLNALYIGCWFCVYTI